MVSGRVNGRTEGAPPSAVRSFRWRAAAALLVVVALHAIGLGLLAANAALGAAAAIPVGLALLAYSRGLIHALDFDHVSMIDNSTRKFLAEGRRPATIGLAFSGGHSTVVIVTGVLVVLGSSAVRSALDEHSAAATVLGLIGVSVSGLYLLLVALANTATLQRAWQLRGQLRADPSLTVDPADLRPVGPAARLLAAPLRRVRHPAQIYGIGMLFSLGFDTSSQIGLLMLTASAGLAGAPPVGLLALPFLFAAAMTLGDTLNGLMMVRVYESASDRPGRMITYNLVVTAVSIGSAVLVALLALAEVLTSAAGVGGLIAGIAGIDTGLFGVGLVAAMIGFGLVALALRRRSRGVGPAL